MKKWRRGNGTMLTASVRRSALSWPGLVGLGSEELGFKVNDGTERAAGEGSGHECGVVWCGVQAESV